MKAEDLGERRESQRERRAAHAGRGGKFEFGEKRLLRRRFPVMRLQRGDEARPVVARERNRRVDQGLRDGRQRYGAGAGASGFPTGVVVTKRMRIATTPETKKAPVGPISALQSTAPRNCRAAGPIASTRPMRMVR